MSKKEFFVSIQSGFQMKANLMEDSRTTRRILLILLMIYSDDAKYKNEKLFRSLKELFMHAKIERCTLWVCMKIILE